MWVGLKYDYVDYGSYFEISEDGNIRNKKSGYVYKTNIAGLKSTVVIPWEGSSARIDVGSAQVESNLERTVFDKEVTPIHIKRLTEERLREIIREIVKEVLASNKE